MGVKFRYRYKIVLSMIILIITLNGCESINKVKEENNNNTDKVYTHEDTFKPLENKDNEQEVTEENIEEEEIINHNEELADIVESNIEIDLDILDEDISQYEWLITPDDMGFYTNVYQWVAYSIYSYYNGEVTENFKCTIPDDIVEQVSNMIFTVKIVGDKGTILDIKLDTYNNKVNISSTQE